MDAGRVEKIACLLLLCIICVACASTEEQRERQGVTQVFKERDTPTRPSSTSQSNSFVETALNRAQAEQQSGQTDRAIKTMERAISVEPRDGRLWLVLAELYYAKNQNEQARTFFQKAKLYPNQQEDFALRMDQLESVLY